MLYFGYIYIYLGIFSIMKICFLTTSYPQFGGDTRGIFIYKLVEALRRYVDVDVITINGYAPLTSGAGILPNLGSSWLARFLFPIYLLHFYSKVFLSSRKCDIIHANWGLTGLLALLTKPFHNKKIILVERSFSLVLGRNSLLRKINNYIYSNVDQLITISDQAKLQLLENYQLKSVKIIINGVDAVSKLLVRKKVVMRKELGLPIKSKILVFVGRLIQLKGVSYLIEGFVKFAKEYKAAYLVVIGEGEKLSGLLDYVKINRLEGRVRFTGNISHSEVINYLLISDLFVFTSLGETGGNVLLEAQACGLPILTTRVGWAEKIIKDGYNGFFINKRDSLDLYKKMVYILKNTCIFNRVSRNSKRVKLQSWDDCARAYVEEYKNLVRMREHGR